MEKEGKSHKSLGVLEALKDMVKGTQHHGNIGESI
jgi:hypothetical protein